MSIIGICEKILVSVGVRRPFWPMSSLNLVSSLLQFNKCKGFTPLLIKKQIGGYGETWEEKGLEICSFDLFSLNKPNTWYKSPRALLTFYYISQLLELWFSRLLGSNAKRMLCFVTTLFLFHGPIIHISTTFVSYIEFFWKPYIVLV